MTPLDNSSGKMIRMAISSDCSICIEPFQKDQDRVLPHPPQLINGRLVTHEFHDECLITWLQNCRDSGTPLFCPLCRSVSAEPQQNLSYSHSLSVPQSQDPPSLANRIHPLPPSDPNLVSHQIEPRPFRMQVLPPLNPTYDDSQQSGAPFDEIFPLLALRFAALQREARLDLLLNSLQRQREVALNSLLNSGRQPPDLALSFAAPSSHMQHLQPMPQETMRAPFANPSYSFSVPSLGTASSSFSSSSSNVAISQPSSSSSSSSNQVEMRNVSPLQISESEGAETPADKYYSAAIRLLNQGDRVGAIGQFIQVANARYYFKKYDPEIACFITHYELAKHFRDDLKDLQKAQLHFSKTIEFRSGCRNPNQLAEARLFMAERYSTGSGRIKKNVDKSLNFLHQIISEPYGVRDDLIQTAKAHFKLYANGIDYSPEAYRQLVKSKKRTSLEALGDNGGNPPKRPREG